jgi:hypothetical protein
MSYKYTVLQDYPSSFFLLDEVRSGEVGSYSSLMSSYSTYQDLKDNGISYAAVSGLPIIDYSGNEMNGYAIESSQMEVLPIIGGTTRGTEINEFSEVSLKSNGIANNKNPDGPFSIEIWFKPDVSDLQEYSIISDVSNTIGIYYKNENVVFKINTLDYVLYKVPKTQAIHAVGTFTKDKISLYVNGLLVSEKPLSNNFKFTNESLSLSVGPANTNKKFIVDAAAVYGYAISNSRILAHYLQGIKELKYSQIVNRKNGILFSLNSVTVRPDISYRYPGIKTLDQLVSGDAYYDSTSNRIYLNKTDSAESKTFSFTERLYVTSPEKIVSSKIVYGQDVNNITVEIQVPGEDWVICKNNNPLPYYNKNQNLQSGILDIRVTINTDDSSTDRPYFDKLEIDMYINKDFYSDNSGYRIYSDYDYSLGQYNYPAKIQNIYNGISMYDGHGFYIDTDRTTQTIEMFFTPDGTSNVLFSSDNAFFKWDESGTVSKNGINSIYINGTDRTSATNIFDFILSDVCHHISITTNSPSSSIKFNQNQSGTEYGLNNLYSNIAIYEDQFTENEILENYNLYCSNNVSVVIEPGLTISEDASGNDNTANYIRLFDDILTNYTQ